MSLPFVKKLFMEPISATVSAYILCRRFMWWPIEFVLPEVSTFSEAPQTTPLQRYQRIERCYFLIVTHYWAQFWNASRPLRTFLICQPCFLFVQRCWWLWGFWGIGFWWWIWDGYAQTIIGKRAPIAHDDCGKWVKTINFLVSELWANYTAQPPWSGPGQPGENRGLKRCIIWVLGWARSIPKL